MFLLKKKPILVFFVAVVTAENYRLVPLHESRVLHQVSQGMSEG